MIEHEDPRFYLQNQDRGGWGGGQGCPIYFYHRKPKQEAPVVIQGEALRGPICSPCWVWGFSQPRTHMEVFSCTCTVSHL